MEQQPLYDAPFDGAQPQPEPKLELVETEPENETAEVDAQ